MKVGVAWVDILTGLTTTIGILAALHESKLSGRGQHVDVSLFDVGVASMANLAQSYLATGEAPMRMGNAHPQVVPYQDFQASDGSFMLAANNDDQFRRLCDAVGLSELADDDRFRDNAARVQHRETLARLLNEKIGGNTRDFWMGALQDAGITVTSINTIADALDDPQAEARKSVWGGGPSRSRKHSASGQRATASQPDSRISAESSAAAWRAHGGGSERGAGHV